MIQLENIHLKLGGPAGEVNILRGINLSVAEGDTVSIVGPSGSGKTTMLMVIAGLEKATSGNVRVNNIDLNTLDEDGLAVFRRETMGIVFQIFHLVPTMSALCTSGMTRSLPTNRCKGLTSLVPIMSSAVITATTPGALRTASRLMEIMLPAVVLQPPTARCSVPLGTAMSST